VGCEGCRNRLSGIYEGLSSAWGEFSRWISTQQLTPAPDLWEFYTTGAESSREASTWRTELDQPLAE